MGLYRTIKQNARRAMSGAWGRAVGILLVSLIPAALIKLLEQGIRMACGVAFYADYNRTPGVALDNMANASLASAAITLAAALLVLIVTAPLAQGVCRWFYRRTAGENDPLGEIFHYFETAGDYFRALGLRFGVGLRLALWAALLCAPLVAARVFSAVYLRRMALPGFASAFFWLLVIAWSMLAAILLAMLALRYLPAPYLLAEHPDWKARQAFAGWWTPAILALLLVAGLPFIGPFYRYDLLAVAGVLAVIQGLMLLYVAPYMRACFAVYARYLIQLGEGAGEEPPVDLTREYRPEELSGELPRTDGAAEE